MTVVRGLVCLCEIGGTAKASGRCAAHEHVEYAFRDEQIARVFINTHRGILRETGMSASASSN